MSRQGPGRKRGTGARSGSPGGGSGRGGGRSGAGGGRGSGGARGGGGGRGGRSSASGGRPRDDRQDIFDAPRAGRKDLGGDQVEGRQAVRELLIGGRRKVREILIVSDLEPAPILEDIRELAESMRVPVREVSKAKFGQEARTVGAQGVVAHAAPIPETQLAELIERDDGSPPFLLAMDGITDPGNLGAVIRTAECVGVTGVLLPRHRAAHITPTVAKAAAGAVEYVPMAVVGGLPTALATLREAGVWIVGLDGGGDQSIYEMTVADEPLCLVLGAEGEGLSKLVRQRCDTVLSIPMSGQLNSLNVSAAAAIACGEVARRREGGL